MKQTEKHKLWAEEQLEVYKRKLTGVIYLDKTVKINTTKKCNRCLLEKPITDFYFSTNQKGSKPQNPCKDCAKKENKNRYKEIRNRVLVKTFNLTQLEYEEKLRQQEYKCGICGIHTDELSKNMAVDHDHNTGKVRGLLCSKCNTAIGLFKDNVDIMYNAIKYLKSTS